jgi:hypothetical protein
MQIWRLLLPCLIAGSSALSGATTFYTSLASFTTAVGTPLTFGFNGLVSGGNFLHFNSAAGLSQNSFQFVGTNGSGGYYLGAEGPTYFSSADYNRGTGSSIQGPAATSSFYGISNGQLTITMPAGGVTAFGIQLWDVLANDSSGAGTDSVRMTVNGASGTVVTPAYSGTAFIGFTSSTPVTSVTLTGTAPEEFPTISNVYYAVAAPKTYSFVGACSDCSGNATAQLVLVNYTQGTALTAANFVSLSYSSNLLSFTLLASDNPSINGTLPVTLPSPAQVSISGPGNKILFTQSSGSWCAGCAADTGTSSTWGLGSLPAPSGVAPVGVPAVGTGVLAGLALAMAALGAHLLKGSRRQGAA